MSKILKVDYIHGKIVLYIYINYKYKIQKNDFFWNIHFKWCDIIVLWFIVLIIVYYSISHLQLLILMKHKNYAIADLVLIIKIKND